MRTTSWNSSEVAEDFQKWGRQFDGAFIDPATGRGTWYEAKSGDFWNKLEENPGRLNKFLSTEGQKVTIARDKGVDYMVISEKQIPDRVTNWLDRKGIPWKVIPNG